MNLSKVLLFFSFTTISSISSAVSAVEYKKHSKSSQNLLRRNIYIHLFRWLPDLSETQCYSFNMKLYRSVFPGI